MHVTSLKSKTAPHRPIHVGPSPHTAQWATHLLVFKVRLAEAEAWWSSWRHISGPGGACGKIREFVS